MSAGTYHPLIEQGATYGPQSVSITTTGGGPFNLTGYTGKAHLRQSVKSDTFFPFTVTIQAPATAGILSFEMGFNITNKIPFTSGEFDLEITNGTLTYRVLEGKPTIKPNVTRS